MDEQTQNNFDYEAAYKKASEEVAAENAQNKAAEKEEKKKKWVNPFISWGALILECAIIAIIAFIVLK